METHSGFTLVELTVVIAIIVILIAVITPNAFRAIEKAKIAKVCYDAKLIDRACEALWSDTGYWPVVDRRRIKQSELMLNIYGWQGWNGPYLEGYEDRHPWGGAYTFCTSLNLGQGSANELSLRLDRTNFDDGTIGHSPPLSVSLKIDQMYYDGGLSTGTIQTAGEYNELFWVLVWDAY